MQKRQIASVLAALRYWQETTVITGRLAYPHFDNIEPLTDDEIDVLCEEINSPSQQKVISFILHDCGSGKGKVKGKIEVLPTGIEVFIDGYGTKTMQPGYGSPVYLELYSTSLRVLVWGDINQEDPTNVISLEGALEADSVQLG